MRSIKWLCFFTAFSLFVSCRKDVKPVDPDTRYEGMVTTTTSTLAASTTENFETGTKTSYAAGDVTLTTGIWTLTDALIGNLSTDVKNGTQSARVHFL
jgi:endonuclease G, mitochondrial